MVWLHVVKWTLQPWWNLLLSLIQVKSGSFVYDPFAGTGTSELLTSHACCANSLMGLTAQTCSAACWWPKLICLMLLVHVIAEVVCRVGEHQHQLAHQCLSCEHFSTHTYEIGMGGHSWLKMGGAFVIWGIYNLNGAVMAKWDIVLGDMLEKHWSSGSLSGHPWDLPWLVLIQVSWSKCFSSWEVLLCVQITLHINLVF